jgi:hypothetical protein
VVHTQTVTQTDRHSAQRMAGKIDIHKIHADKEITQRFITLVKTLFKWVINLEPDSKVVNILKLENNFFQFLLRFINKFKTVQPD